MSVTANHIMPGFSLTNRMLLYASVLLAPAQFAAGMHNNCPSNLGFLAYNLYNQILWFRAVRARRLHALCMILPNFNLIYAFSFLGGITSGNVVMGVFLGLGTGGALLLNTASAWISWTTNQPQGFGVYRFFFFGPRTLTAGWHRFMLYWQIFDSILAVGFAVGAIVGAIAISTKDDDRDDESAWGRWFVTLLYIPLGAALCLILVWPDVLWTEMIVARNHIVSDTDWIAVWLFVAQAVTMVAPPCTAYLGCLRRR
ncbi:uncharacterized protein PV07_08083 [Cladophialophora immunda]|uniref:Uncharacterized protein n=1 Tax=Cladophialophora immunda TaxID=569365 RepID=A0A0D1ZK95_9EURO|nr:uncharacterized protein PV07_08083 [Cladophialophora immunda]KIW28416.1 hypothetical protein PV07_08083 [Cladophialophora immunda]OQU94988.1 hypothetical protein CLAIMM_01260 [Cladophialophora immunda]